MAHIAAIGEVMVELAPFPTTDGNGREIMALSFAGDTYNTSVYMARLAPVRTPAWIRTRICSIRGAMFGPARLSSR